MATFHSTSTIFGAKELSAIISLHPHTPPHVLCSTALYSCYQEYRGNPRGIVPIWRARVITAYKSELLPAEPSPLPVKDSADSLIDIMDYLKQQYKEDAGMEDEGAQEHSEPTPPPSPEQPVETNN